MKTSEHLTEAETAIYNTDLALGNCPSPENSPEAEAMSEMLRAIRALYMELSKD